MRTHLSRGAGLLCGLALAAALLAAGRLPASAHLAGARVAMLTQAPTYLEVQPVGLEFLNADGLRPGLPASGRIRIRNLLDAPLTVAALGRPAGPDLARELRVELWVAGARRFSGTLEDLQKGTAPFTLAPRQDAEAEFRVSLPVGLATRAYVGHATRVRIAWQARRKATP